MAADYRTLLAETQKHIRELEAERDRLRDANTELRRVASVLLEAHMDGHGLSIDEIEDAYDALEEE